MALPNHRLLHVPFLFPPFLQSALKAALSKLAFEHPHHTLTHLLAIKHGNYNASGKPSKKDSSGYFQHEQARWDVGTI